MKVNASPRRVPAGAPSGAVADMIPPPPAARMLEAAMHESQAPVLQVGESVERMLKALRSGLPAAELERLFSRELALCVHGLQFHDRLMQQLSCVHGLLCGPSAPPITAAPARFPQQDGADGSIELF